jgi:peroxiredoxin
MTESVKSRGGSRRPDFSAARLMMSLCAALLACLAPTTLLAEKQAIVWNDQERPIREQIRRLRALPDDARAHTTKDLALKIRELPKTENKLRLATSLANLSTEGDFGRDTLQDVTTTLADTLREQPPPDDHGGPAAPYVVLAQLVRYEHMQASLDAPPFAAAMAKLEADDQLRQKADFTLTDLQGKKWTLSELHGKVVLVNFWATWCPPCRKEMPDLQALYEQFRDQGLAILAISDEEAGKVTPFLAERKITYPVMLDGGKVHQQFQVEGIPKSFVYDRNGKLVAQSVDMRTRKQFMEMLGMAGMR